MLKYRPDKINQIMTRSVKKYYTGCVSEEWERLVKNSYYKLEFDVTLHFLKKYLPKKGLILDAGGGPGRYSLELARQGYDIILLDVAPANLEFAERQIKKEKLQNKVKDVIRGSIVDLSRFPDNTFDSVICLGGPLSHILESKKRDKAISELTRVARRHAPVFVSVMSRLGLLANTLKFFPNEIGLPRFKKYRDTGDYVGGYGFTACHYFLPEELEKSFTKKNIKILEMAGLEGIGSHLQEKINELARNKKRWKMWLETHYKTCTHPTVIGISEHILIVYKKL